MRASKGPPIPGAGQGGLMRAGVKWNDDGASVPGPASDLSDSARSSNLFLAGQPC